MARPSRAQLLLDKGESALVAAIEIYNKPNFPYREETFAILALNAWELLLKAKLLQEKKNRVHALHTFESRTLKSGHPSRKRYLRRNRAGNPHTIGLGATITVLANETNTQLAEAVRQNLNALTEVRDNAVHFVNASPLLAKQVWEIGTSAIRNYVMACRRWFDRDLSKYNMYLMPLGFVGAGSLATALPTSPAEKNLVTFLSQLVSSNPGSSTDDYSVSLEVEISLTRSGSQALSSVRVTDESDATPIELREEYVRKRFPWDYAELTRRLVRRYTDFKANGQYHSLRKRLMQDPKLGHKRYLDPGNPKSARKDYYNPNIVSEFDRCYTRI